MKRILAFFIMVILLVASGCTQSSPAITTSTHVATVTISPVLSQKSIATSRPTTVPTSEAEQTPAVSDNTVLIKNNAFDPQVVTVKKGATVRWENSDTSAHRIRFADGYTAQLLSPGQSWSKVFTNPGLFDYTDLVNPNLHGTVKVE